MTKYHIGKNGSPSKCNASVKNCPYGGAYQHYSSIEDAEAVARVDNEMCSPGFLGEPPMKLKKATSELEKDYIRIRLEIIENNSESKNKEELTVPPKIERIKSSTVLEEFNPNVVESFHFKKERKNRMKAIDSTCGRGEPIATFKTVEEYAPGMNREVYARIHDTGFTEYFAEAKDENGETKHVLVTGLIASKNTAEILSLKAGVIFSKDTLDSFAKSKTEYKAKEKENRIEAIKREEENQKLRTEKINRRLEIRNEANKKLNDVNAYWAGRTKAQKIEDDLIIEEECQRTGKSEEEVKNRLFKKRQKNRARAEKRKKALIEKGVLKGKELSTEKENKEIDSKPNEIIENANAQKDRENKQNTIQSSRNENNDKKKTLVENKNGIRKEEDTKKTNKNSSSGKRTSSSKRTRGRSRRKSLFSKERINQIKRNNPKRT